ADIVKITRKEPKTEQKQTRERKEYTRAENYQANSTKVNIGTDTESKPFEGEAKTPESPYIVAPPTCQVEESEGYDTSDVRFTSSDSNVPLSSDHPLTHTTPALVPILHSTARIVVRVSPAMSPDLSVGIVEVAAMSDLAFRKRSRSSYDSSPSPTLPVWKRYRGTSEIILYTDREEDKEVKESLDSDSVSEDVKDEGPTAKDEDPAAWDEGLASGDKGPSMRVESRGLDNEGHRVESDGRGLREEEEAVPEGQQQVALVVGTSMSAPLGLGYEALRRRELALEEDHVYSTFEVDPGDGMVYIDVPAYPPLAPPVQTPPSPEWSSGLFPISPAPSIVPLPISSPIISLNVPSPIASPVATPTATIPVDEDQFIERYRLRSLEHKQERTAMTFRALCRLVLALEAWTGRVDTRMTDMSRSGYDDHRLVYDMLLQQTALQRELQEKRGRVTALEQERDSRERGANRKVIDREWSRGILERAVMIKLET
nr:hypothetical protein [Tanacetum cinerariifolium]